MDDSNVLEKKGFWEIDFKTGQICYSKYAWTILGPGIETVMGSIRSVMEHVHKDDLTLVSDALINGYNNHEPYDLDFRIYRTDGELIHLEIKGKVCLDKNQVPVSGKGFFKDITEIKRVQKVQRESETKLKAIVNNNPDVISLVDESGILLYCNESVKTILGYEQHEFVGLHALEFIHPDDKTRVKKLFEEFLPNFGGHILIEARFRHKNKSWRHLEVSASNQLKNSAVNAVVINTRDISERKKLEEQLIHSQKVETLGLLTAGIAHDFNNSISIINGFGTLLKMSYDKLDTKYQYIDKILYTTNRASGLIQQLMAFGRKQVVEAQVININDCVKRLNHILKRLIRSEIELELKLSPDLGLIKIDPVQFEQVVINLVINAKDAIESSGKITIETGNFEHHQSYNDRYLDLPNGEYVRLKIIDSGKGISKDIKEKIFDPFFTTKQKGHGTGLGLAIVQKIVKEYHGLIFVDSALENGTTFDLFFKRSSEAKSEPDSLNGYESFPKGHEQILVVEDDENFRFYLCEFLQSLGYKITASSSAENALKRCANMPENDNFHLILVEEMILKTGGEMPLNILTNLNPNVGLVLMTSYEINNSNLQNFSGSKAKYLQKPFQSKELACIVRKVLDAD